MSFVYFGAVFGCEVIITINPPCIRGKEFNWKFGKDKSKAESARKKKLGIEDDDELDANAGPLSLKSNPLMSGASVIKGDARVKAEDLCVVSGLFVFHSSRECAYVSAHYYAGRMTPPRWTRGTKLNATINQSKTKLRPSQDALADLRAKINELKKSAAMDKDSMAGKSSATRRSISVKKREFGARSAKRRLPRGKRVPQNLRVVHRRGSAASIKSMGGVWLFPSLPPPPPPFTLNMLVSRTHITRTVIWTPQQADQWRQIIKWS